MNGIESGMINLVYTVPTVSNASISLSFVDLLIRDVKGTAWMLKSKTVEFKNIDFYEIPALQTSMKIIGDFLFYLTCTSLGIAALTLNPEAFFINFRMQQSVELLMMLNIPKPANLLALVDKFQTSLITKLYNPFKKMIVTDCGLPGSFSQKGLGCLIVDNIGGMWFWFVMFIVIMNIIHIVYRLVVKTDKNTIPPSQRTNRTDVPAAIEPKPEEQTEQTPPPSKGVRLLTFAKENLEWPCLMNFFYCFFIDLTLHSLLQVINARKTPNYFAFNSIFGIILLFLCGFYIVANYLLVNAFATEREVFLENKAFFLLFISTDKTKRLQKFYSSFMFGKYFILVCIVVLFNLFEFVHCLLFMIVQSLFVFRFLVPPPYTAKDRNIREYVHEWFVLGGSVVIFLGTTLLRVFSNQLTRYTILGSIACGQFFCYILWTNVVALSMVYHTHLKPHLDAYLLKKKQEKEALEAKKLAETEKDPSMLENLNQTQGAIPSNSAELPASLAGTNAANSMKPKADRKLKSSKASVKASLTEIPINPETKPPQSKPASQLELGEPQAAATQKKEKSSGSKRGSILSAQLNQSVLTDASGKSPDHAESKSKKFKPSRSRVALP